MPTDGNTQTYGFLDQLSTEQLLDLVRADLDSPEEEDEDLTVRILEVIERRDETGIFDSLPDTDQAWEDFQKYFNTPNGTGRSLYPMRDSDLTAIEDSLGKRRGHGKLLRRLLPLAAVVAVAFSSMVAAQAFGLDVFGALARWTDETFHFISGTPASAGSEESEALRQAVQEAFDSCGITIPAPSWYPEGTELAEDIDITQNDECSIVMCDFKCGNGFWGITVQQYYRNDRISSYTFEKDAQNVEEYYSNGRLFYIVSNLSESYATYSNDQTVIVINGKLSPKNLKQIIDSIGA